MIVESIKRVAHRAASGAAALWHVARTQRDDHEGLARFRRLLAWQTLAVVLLAAPLIAGQLFAAATGSDTVKFGAQTNTGADHIKVGPLEVTRTQKSDGDDLYIGAAPKDAKEKPPETGWSLLWSRLAGAWTTLLLMQFVVIALTRDFTDQAERRLAARLGQPVGPAPPRPPRVRIDFAWLKRKAQRRWWMIRPLITIGLVTFPFALIPLVGGKISSTFATLTTAWLFVVGTAAKTSRAWDDEFDTNPPFVAFALERGRWWPLTWLARMWRWSWTRLQRPATAASACAPEMAGLAFARIVGVVPFVGLALRPLVPLAATSLLPASRATTLETEKVATVLEETTAPTALPEPATELVATVASPPPAVTVPELPVPEAVTGETPTVSSRRPPTVTIPEAREPEEETASLNEKDRPTSQ